MRRRFGTRLATLIALVAPVAPAAAAPPAIEVTTPTTRADALEVRLQGDASVLAHRRTVVGADRVIRIWLPAFAAPRTVTLAHGPAYRVAVRRIGRRSVVSIHLRNDLAAGTRRVRLIEEKGALTMALFSDDGALAEWIAAHVGARLRTLPIASRAAAPRVAPPAAPRDAVAEPILAAGLARATPDRDAVAPSGPPVPSSLLSTVPSPSRLTVPSIARIAEEVPLGPDPAAKPAPVSPAPLLAPAIAPTARRASAPTPVVSAPAPRESSDLTRTAVVGAMLVLVAVAVWMRRRSGRPPGEDASIRVLSSRGLGGKHRVSVLEVGPDRFLVALDPGGTRLISRLERAFARHPEDLAEGHRIAGTPAPTLTRNPAGAATAQAPTRASAPAASLSSEAERDPRPRLTLVDVAREATDAVAARRARTLTPAVGALLRHRAPSTHPVPLARLATHAVPASPPSALLSAAAAHPRARTAPEPQPQRGTNATGPTILVAATPPFYETDVEGLLRLKSAMRKAA